MESLIEMADNISALQNVLEAKHYLSFSWGDYALFLIMFGLSTLIGIYFGCFGSKQSSTSEYLLGGKSMGIFPIAMSLTASHISGISLLGIPADIYLHGTQYWMCIVSMVIVGALMIYVFLPVFYNLKLNSSYEYLKLRFDDRIRKMASVLYIINSLLYIPIVIYIPALALNQVTRLSIHLITPILCIICIFYTTIGGLKAVVWSDALQFTVTLGAMFTVFFMGIVSTGGFASIWNKAEQRERIEFFNWTLDPTERTSFWSILVGLTVSWLSLLGVNPASVQRFLAVPTLRDAKIVMYIFVISTIVTKSVSIFSGLIMFAKYFDCDPLLNGDISRSDQLLPYYVLDVARNMPGLSGLFISGVFSTALSAMSTNLNTLSGTIYEDFIAPVRKSETPEKHASNIMKVTVVLVGLICVGLVFIVEHLGGVFQICISLCGVASGPLLGLFVLGMLAPIANSKGALYGSISGLLVISWICLGAQLHVFYKNIVYEPKPLGTQGCNTTIDLNENYEYRAEDVFWVFKISFHYYTLMGILITIPVGLIVSWFTRSENIQLVERNLLSPCIHRFLPKETPVSINKKYTTVADALHVVASDAKLLKFMGSLDEDKFKDNVTDFVRRKSSS